MRYFLSGFIPRGSLVLAGTTFGSYVLGLFRDRTFAHVFGASAALDSYNAAFLVPDFLFNFLVASGIAAAAVPLFIESRKKSKQEAQVYMNSITTLAVLVMLFVGLFIALAAPVIAPLVAPGLDEASKQIVVQLMRILSISPVLFAASNAFGALLVAQKRFFFYGLSPMMYNLGIIGGSIYLVPIFGIPGVAYGTIIGASFHLVVRVVDALWAGWRPVPIIQFPIPRFRQTVRLMAPKMIGHPVELVTFWVFTSLASFLSTGSIAVLNFARNFQSVPVSILGIAIATAVFPSLADAAVRSQQELRRLFHKTAGIIIVVSGAAALGMFVVREFAVRILLGGGQFDETAIEKTALTLGVFCLAIPTESLNHLFARSFYATKNTTIPVLFSVASLVISAASAYWFMQIIGIAGLPLGFFLGSLTKAIGLFTLFRRRTRS